MSFGQELKDFAAGFKVSNDALYTNERRKALKRENDSHFDLDAAAKAEGADTGEEDGLLYNLGQWLSPHKKKKTAGPMGAAQAVQALPLDGYSGVNSGSTAFAFPNIEDDEEDRAVRGYAQGGLVLPEDSVTVTGNRQALPLPEDAVTSVAYRTGPDNDGGPPVPEDGGDDDGRDPFAAQPKAERAVEVRPLGAIPSAAAQVATDNDGRDPVGVDPRDDDGRDPVAAIPAGEHAVTTANLGDPTRKVAAADVETPMKYTLGNALDGGIRALMSEFKLDPKSGAVPDEEALKGGRAALMNGEGRASTADIKQVVQAVDPDGKLSHSQAMLRAMTKGYEFYMERGDPVKANNYAAMIIQYSNHQASQHGEDALYAMKQGNMPAAVKSLEAGYSNVLDGKDVQDVQLSPDGKSAKVKQVDAETGKLIAEHTLSGEQLYQAAIGLQNKTATWDAIMTAAQAVKTVNLPQSQAYEDAQLRLAGANPDGSPLTDGGNAGVGNAGPGDQAIPADAASRSGPTTPAIKAGATASLPQPAAGGAAYDAMMRAGESSNRANAKNGDSVGLYQIQSAAWRDHTGHDPIVNGVDERLDPVKNKAVFDKLTAANTMMFKNKTNRDPSPVELAVMHQQGATGGLRLMLADPKTPALQVIPDRRKLEANGIANPEQATVGDVVNHIKSYYGQHLPGKTGQPATDAGVQSPPQAAGPAPLDLRPVLPEDQPATPDIPVRPTPPVIRRVRPDDTRGMSPQERVAYTRQVAKTNQEEAKQFQQNMQLYTTALKAAKPPARGKDPLALPVKDRGDPMAMLKEAKTVMVDDATNPTSTVFKGMQPQGQRATDDLAYALYTHNDTTPQRAYQAAVSMISSGAKPNPDGTLNISTPYTPHKLPDGNVKIVFRTGDKMVIPYNAFREMSSARGNEIFVAREGATTAAKKAGENKALADKGSKALAAVPGAAVGGLDVVVNGPGRAVRAIPEAVAGIPSAASRMVDRSVQRAREENKIRPVSAVK